MEEESLEEEYREGIIEERSIWEASGMHLGCIRKASGRHPELKEAMELQEAPITKNDAPLG